MGLTLWAASKVCRSPENLARRAPCNSSSWASGQFGVGDIIIEKAETMTIEEQVLEKLRGLTPERKKEVLDFVSRLKDRGRKAPRRSLRGLWADLNLKISEEDIAQARRNMWSTFPRGIC
jgi:hypothetical protein